MMKIRRSVGVCTKMNKIHLGHKEKGARTLGHQKCSIPAYFRMSLQGHQRQHPDPLTFAQLCTGAS